jgi:hypothetical protein
MSDIAIFRQLSVFSEGLDSGISLLAQAAHLFEELVLSHPGPDHLFNRFDVVGFQVPSTRQPLVSTCKDSFSTYDAS